MGTRHLRRRRSRSALRGRLFTGTGTLLGPLPGATPSRRALPQHAARTGAARSCRAATEKGNRGRIAQTDVRLWGRGEVEDWGQKVSEDTQRSEF